MYPPIYIITGVVLVSYMPTSHMLTVFTYVGNSSKISTYRDLLSLGNLARQGQSHDKVTDIEKYWNIHRRNAGSFLTFALFELELDFSKEVNGTRFRGCVIFSSSPL